MLHPLLAQHDHQAEADPVDGQDQAQPPGQRTEPGLPRDAFLAQGKPFVEEAHGVVFRGGNEPVRQVGVDKGGPLVLGHGAVVRLGDDAHDVADDEYGDAAGSQPHERGGDQFGRSQAPGAAAALDGGVGQDEEDERDADADGKVGPGDLGRADDPDRIRGAQADDQDHGQAGEHGPPGDAPAGQFHLVAASEVVQEGIRDFPFQIACFPRIGACLLNCERGG